MNDAEKTAIVTFQACPTILTLTAKMVVAEQDKSQMQGTTTEAYRPAVDDGRARFPEAVKAQAPKGMAAAITAAARIKHTTNAEYVRQALLRSLASDGVKLRRGMVIVGEQAA